jgi:hypothetical protein
MPIANFGASMGGTQTSTSAFIEDGLTHEEGELHDFNDVDDDIFSDAVCTLLFFFFFW